MKHDVFVSYSSKDKAIADAVVAALEQQSFRCWYAPRDIKPGADWGESITEAINASKIVLLIFSGNSNQSKRVRDEIFYAIAEEKTLIPFRIENLDPTGAMRLHLSSLHWLDAYQPSWQSHIERLVKSVSVDLGSGTPSPVGEAEHPGSTAREPQKAPKKTLWLWAGLAVAFLAILAGATFWWLGESQSEKDAQPTAMAALAQTSDISTATQTQTLKPMQTQTSTPTPSSTPRPSATGTQTPAPAWVAEFSEPVIQMIAGHNPNESTGFDLGIPGWLKFGECSDFRIPYVNEGELIWTEDGCDIKWSMWYTDFVIEMDVRHVVNQSGWMFFFRAGGGYTFGPDYIDILDAHGGAKDQVSVSLSDPYRLRIIVQGYETALYVNDQPMLYGSLPAGFKNGEVEWFHGSEGMPVAFDNIQIWNLNNLK